MSDLLNRIKVQLLEFENERSLLVSELQKEFPQLLKPLLEQSKKIENIGWTQYTTYFNGWRRILFIIPFLFLHCRSVVNPNEWVVSTVTCWNTMSVTKAGNVIPRLVTSCDRMVILPATEMSAELSCETKFANRVAGSISIAYQWRIADPILFIQSAKSITSSATSKDHKIDPNALESIENGVVDKILIDIIREYTPNKEAGIDELSVEKDLDKLAKVQVSQRGVEFSNMSVNINFGPQTEEALDVISALKFYQSNNEEELGRKVIVEKAGSANIHTSSEK